MRKIWTEQMIATELGSVIVLDGSMPSAQRLRQLGKNDLACQISRKGGFLSWASRLGAKRNKSDSDTGWDGEIALSEKLSRKGFSVERMNAVKAPYDLKVEGCIRVDVKSANYAEYGASKGWFFRIGKEPQADVIALYQLDTGVCYFIPWMLCPVSNITISRDGGKWASFKDRYETVEKLASTRLLESSLWV